MRVGRFERLRYYYRPMRVTRIEIFGFKSFRDRFVLNLDEPVIGIVGPNGCGKSNIVDALRWVSDS